MLRSYLENGEKIFLYKSFKGEKHSRKDTIFLVVGILFGIVSFDSLVLAIIFKTVTLLLPFLIAGSCAYGLLYYFLKLNKLHLSQNENICVEYLLTNKKFLYVDLKNPTNILKIPISDFVSAKIRTNHQLNSTSSLVIRLNGTTPLTPVYNDIIEISNEEVSIHQISNSILIKNSINFLLFLINNNIKDMYDINNFLEFGEIVLYTENHQNKPMTLKLSKNMLFFLKYGLIAAGIFFLLEWYSGASIFGLIFNIIICLWVALIFRKGNIILQIRNNKKSNDFSVQYYCNLKYVITNKRVLFFDFDVPILYAFRFDELDYVSVNNYNKKSDIGDIYLSNRVYSSYVANLVNGRYKRTNKYEYFFPNNYTLHKLFIDLDIMNCCKMKLYGVKSPNNIINKYIVHHVKNFDKNKNTK
jgi:hypothetical protein